MYKLIMRWARFSIANAPTSPCPTPAYRTKSTTFALQHHQHFIGIAQISHPISLTFRPEHLIYMV